MVERCACLRGWVGRGAASFTLLTSVLPAFWPPAAANAQLPRSGQLASVSGAVYDSIAAHPLASARVELVNADTPAAPVRSVETDTLGMFRFDDVGPGRYLIGFAHPTLDSIGIERAPRALTVRGSEREVRIDLALPSAQSLRVAICGASAVADSVSLIIGIVRDASTRSAVASSTVTVQWADFILASGGLKRNMEQRTFETQEGGWYALCGAPAGGSILLAASHDADTTESLALDVPSAGFLRRDLFFGVAREISRDTPGSVMDAANAENAATTTATDSLALTVASRRTGAGRLTGIVVNADGGRPLAGATVAITNGPQVRADDRGHFTVQGVPTGTRMLEVRAVGYSPVLLPVDVVDGVPPLRIPLVSLKALLDTVRVRAHIVVNRDLEGFDRRRKHGGANGRFMTAEDIARRNPVDAVDVFRSMPGILIARDTSYNEILAQRNMFLNLTTSQSQFCRVSVFVNGTRLNDPTVDLLRGYLRVSALIGIEVYSGGHAPPEFTKRDGCGSVLIWTR